MRVFGGLLRVFSYVFHFVLAIFFFGLSVVTLATGHPILSLGMLPWRGDALTWWVFALSLLGLLSVLLAVTGKGRWLFVLWSFVALVLMIRGFFFSSYHFANPAQARSAVWLTVGVIAAFAGSLMDINETPRNKSWR